MSSTTTLEHPVVSQSEWLRASREFLDKEKELTRLSDQLARERRKLPWTRVKKNYVFDGPAGPVSLLDLFGERSQLAIYHFMFGPDSTGGCPSCSFVTDHFNGMLPHLNARNVSFALISRAPLEKLLPFKQRLGWTLPWFSSGQSDFNYDFGVTFTKEQVANREKSYNHGSMPPYGEENPGMSFFYKDANGVIYHTYSTYARGLDLLLGAYVVLDRAPKGRDEEELSFSMAWVRYHDEYDPKLVSLETCCHTNHS